MLEFGDKRMGRRQGRRPIPDQVRRGGLNPFTRDMSYRRRRRRRRFFGGAAGVVHVWHAPFMHVVAPGQQTEPPPVSRQTDGQGAQRVATQNPVWHADGLPPVQAVPLACPPGFSATPTWVTQISAGGVDGRRRRRRRRLSAATSPASAPRKPSRANSAAAPPPATPLSALRRDELSLKTLVRLSNFLVSNAAPPCIWDSASASRTGQSSHGRDDRGIRFRYPDTPDHMNSM